ncbi:hypothetical protein HerbRD11066_17570 [Herbidospora sp. RD11066]
MRDSQVCAAAVAVCVGMTVMASSNANVIAAASVDLTPEVNTDSLRDICSSGAIPECHTYGMKYRKAKHEFGKLYIRDAIPLFIRKCCSAIWMGFGAPDFLQPAEA